MPRLRIAAVVGDMILDVTPAARAAWEGSSSLDVILVACGVNKIAVIKAVRELTGIGLKEAKGVVEATALPGGCANPQPVKRGLAPDVAAAAAKLLRDAGATVDIRPSS